MQLEGQAHDKLHKKAGKYTMAKNLSSGMPYWTNSEGTKALWFTDGQWQIGPKSYLNSKTTHGLRSTNSTPCPESVGSHWKYWDDGEFLDAQGNAKMYKYEGMTYQGNKQFIYGEFKNLNSN